MRRQIIQTAGEAVAYLYDTPRFTTKNTIEDTKRHLKKLGSPDEKIRNIIHVAGTNGKGSVCAYLRYCLEEAGYKTAVFTSPHLTDIRERFAINGEMIGEDDFLRLFGQVYDSLDWESLEAGGGYHPTFFEFLFFMAMLYFAEQDPDYCIMETGLGGRLDATNSVSHKELTIITGISADHTEYLGETIPEIAFEKAGIMRAGVPLAYADTKEDASRVFVEQAKNLPTKACPVSKNDYVFHEFRNKSIDFSLHTRYYGYIGVTLHTQALYQMENAALAVRALEVLSGEGHFGGQIPLEAITGGLERAYWPGRMEEVLPEVYVDGAHNADGIRAFLESVGADGCEARGQKRILIFSVVSDKDYRSMAGQILDCGLFDRIYVTHIASGRALPLEVLREFWTEADATRSRGTKTGGQGIAGTEFAKDVREALRRASSSEEGKRIYVAGSLYLVGEIKEFLNDDKF